MAKKIKFKSKLSLPSLNSTKFGRLIKLLLLVIITAGLLVSAIIALPQTERVLTDTDFDLNLKENEYQGRSYTLDLQIRSEDKEGNEQIKIERTKNIIHRRLNEYGVEVVKVSDLGYKEEESEDGEEDESETPIIDQIEQQQGDIFQVRYVVETSKNLDSVDRLVSSRNYVRIVVPKEDVVLDDPEDAIAPYLKENYEYTRFTLHNFRSVVVKELPTTTGETAFFAIYKPHLLRQGEFEDLLDEYASKQIGVMIDGFVQPVNVPFEFNKEAQQSGAQKPEFAPAVASTEDEAEVASILYNAGVIPLQYSVSDQEDVEVSVVKPDYYTSLAVVITAILGIVVFIGWRNLKTKEENLTFVLSVLATYSIWLTILKLTNYPVDLDIMYFTGFLLIFLIKLFNYRKTSIYAIELSVGSILLLLYLFGEGYTKIFAQQMLLTSILAVVVIFLMRYYTYNMKKYVLK